jgi:hypothetical protein
LESDERSGILTLPQRSSLPVLTAEGASMAAERRVLKLENQPLSDSGLPASVGCRVLKNVIFAVCS